MRTWGSIFYNTVTRRLMVGKRLFEEVGSGSTLIVGRDGSEGMLVLASL